MTDLAILEDKIPAHLKKSEGRGNEGVGNSVVIPRIDLVYPSSKPIQEGWEGWKAGDFRHNLNDSRIPGEFLCINIWVACYWMVAPKWGASVPDYRRYDFPTQKEALSHYDSIAEANRNNYESFEEHAHMLVLKDEDTGALHDHPVMFHMNKSKTGVSKKWNSQLQSYGGDRFSNLWRVKSVPVVSKATSSTYPNIEIERIGWAIKEDFEKAEEIYKSYAGVSFDR